MSLGSHSLFVKGGILLTTPVSDATVRTFFIYRIWILSRKNKLLVYPLTFLALIVFGIGLGKAIFLSLSRHLTARLSISGFGIKGVAYTNFHDFSRLAWLLYFGLGLLFFVDGYVSLSLIILLYFSRRGFSSRTDSIINILILYTINTGLLTSLSTLACLIMYAAMPTNYVFLALYFPLSKLYLNAFLATLNARDALRSAMTSGTPMSIPLSTTAGKSQTRPPLVFKSDPSHLESGVTIEQDVYITSDARSSRHERDEF
ncbi:hypothetical protein QCA50_016347 [Cerrena zonata]|uniref:DUF6534 domain-containing protein n=1 Tax=Cerrena zonata TaxID=2478898 RepID=A0AAW0FG64_9APHY